jgi:hypothetical protein
MTKRAFATCLLACIGMALQAQDHPEANAGTLRLPFNVSFVPGLSVADLIAGPGDQETEVSGINLSIIGGSIDYLNGVSLSGVFGEVKKDARGGEWAGVFNVIGGDARGITAAGVFNVAKHTMGGLQGAGVFNIAEEVTGFQAAGVFNIDEGNLGGGQGAGVFNVTKGSLHGIQMAGVFNHLAGDGVGAQLGGVFNSADGELRGVQIAGIFNTATHIVEGLQLGLVNYADEHDGVPIGLVSYVKSVGLRYDAWIDESQFGYIGVHSGTSRFYNVVALGAQGNSPFRWLVGAGFGYQVQFVGDLLLEVGFFSAHVNEQGDGWTSGTNLLNKIKCVGVIDLPGTPDLFVGLTLNLWVSDVHDGSDVAQYTIRVRQVGTTWVRVWPGLVAGVRF